ncbi:unnamed protein product [Rhizoctonia solani]|uniref:Protein kinase domain-containing protein n=1 Tax=Rhizoctonia solani TaxID=456999 RepID=A0A8H3DZM3_9AGAM|nr:unnamed protein product [Rhizoctonia solani]
MGSNTSTPTSPPTSTPITLPTSTPIELPTSPPPDNLLWSEHTLEITAPACGSPHARTGHSVVSSETGEIFIFGGSERGKCRNDTWVISLSKDSDPGPGSKDDLKDTRLMASLLETTGEAPSPRVWHQSVVAKGRLIVWGGLLSNERSSHTPTDNSIYSLSIATRHWTKLDIQPAPSARYDHAACLCGSKFIVFGGRVGDGQIVNDMWSLDVDLLEINPKWEQTESVAGGTSPPRRVRNAIVAYGSQLYIFVGSQVDCLVDLGSFTAVWRFDMTTQVWANIIFPGGSAVPAGPDSGVQLIEDAIYVFGGYGNNRISCVFKISEQKWYQFPELYHRPSARYGHALSAIGGRMFLVTGLENEKYFVASMTVHGLNTDLINFPKGGSEITIKPTPMDPPRLARDSMIATTLDTITGAMSATEIMRHLVAHGCRDLSTELDVSHVSEYPVSQGGSGDVYIATLSNGDRKGLKCIRMLVGSTDEGRKFLKHAAHELYVWSKCKHPSILELSGVTIFRDQVAMVSPWVENGHLRWFLSQHPQANRCALCIRIADGVDYLHKNGTVHGDLKPENILVGKDHVPKLTDFGNAVLSEYTLQFTHSNTSQGMTMRWTAPEILSEETKTTQAGDVYALGMIIFEVITGALPYVGVKDAVIMRRIIAGIIPSRPETHVPSGVEQADRLWSLITRCWAFNPLERPKAWEVKNIMDEMTPEGLLANRS